jgi:hypothetical protein
MPRTPALPARRGAAARTLGIGCALIVVLVIGALVATFGYFGPGLPKQDYLVAYEQHVLDHSGLDDAAAHRSRRLTDELEMLRRQELAPILYTDAYKLGGSEIIDPDLPPEHAAAIGAALDAMEASAMHARVDELISVGVAVEGGGSLVRHLARLYSGQLVLAWRAGDAEAAALAYTRLRGLANASAQGSMTIIGRLVSIAVDIQAMSTLRTLLAERSGDRAMLEALWQASQTAPDRDAWPGMAAVLEGERFIARDMIQGEGFSVPIRAINAGAADQDFGRLQDDVLAAWSERGSERIASIREGAPHWYDGLGNLASIVAPAYERFLAVEIESVVLELATRVALAVELHRARTGALPARLDDLVPSLLAALPLDPATDEPFRYILDEASPIGYRLYAVGFDGVDNDGTPGGEDASAMDFNATGIDYPIMPPDIE